MIPPATRRSWSPAEGLRHGAKSAEAKTAVEAFALAGKTVLTVGTYLVGKPVHYVFNRPSRNGKLNLWRQELVKYFRDEGYTVQKLEASLERSKFWAKTAGRGRLTRWAELPKKQEQFKRIQDVCNNDPKEAVMAVVDVVLDVLPVEIATLIVNHGGQVPQNKIDHYKTQMTRLLVHFDITDKNDWRPIFSVGDGDAKTLDDPTLQELAPKIKERVRLSGYDAENAETKYKQATKAQKDRYYYQIGYLFVEHVFGPYLKMLADGNGPTESTTNLDFRRAWENIFRACMLRSLNRHYMVDTYSYRLQLGRDITVYMVPYSGSRYESVVDLLNTDFFKEAGKTDHPSIRGRTGYTLPSDFTGLADYVRMLANPRQNGGPNDLFCYKNARQPLQQYNADRQKNYNKLKSQSDKSTTKTDKEALRHSLFRDNEKHVLTAVVLDLQNKMQAIEELVESELGPLLEQISDPFSRLRWIEDEIRRFEQFSSPEEGRLRSSSSFLEGAAPFVHPLSGRGPEDGGSTTSVGDNPPASAPSGQVSGTENQIDATTKDSAPFGTGPAEDGMKQRIEEAQAEGRSSASSTSSSSESKKKARSEEDLQGPAHDYHDLRAFVHLYPWTIVFGILAQNTVVMLMWLAWYLGFFRRCFFRCQRLMGGQKKKDANATGGQKMKDANATGKKKQRRGRAGKKNGGTEKFPRVLTSSKAKTLAAGEVFVDATAEPTWSKKSEDPCSTKIEDPCVADGPLEEASADVLSSSDGDADEDYGDASSTCSSSATSQSDTGGDGGPCSVVAPQPTLLSGQLQENDAAGHGGVAVAHGGASASSSREGDDGIMEEDRIAESRARVLHAKTASLFEFVFSLTESEVEVFQNDGEDH
ncbi:unnamed protein product [Amoebophrya sp. A120]|nr:unnamed protein product [Amoebophrya sp. A120]|eukprot:GSA120T00012058001.1